MIGWEIIQTLLMLGLLLIPTVLYLSLRTRVKRLEKSLMECEEVQFKPTPGKLTRRGKVIHSLEQTRAMNLSHLPEGDL